jgi:hypothetical protein
VSTHSKPFAKREFGLNQKTICDAGGFSFKSRRSDPTKALDQLIAEIIRIPSKGTRWNTSRCFLWAGPRRCLS